MAAGTVGEVLGAGDVLDEVHVVRVVVLLVHALTGGSLTLEMSPLRGAWLTTNMGEESSGFYKLRHSGQE